jgi:hypothetical protein
MSRASLNSQQDNANTDEIITTERELNLIGDMEMWSELERYRHFNILNNEKMSPRFISLSKIKANSDSLDKVRRPDGSAFESTAARQDYTNDFYQTIYTPDQGNIELTPTVIEDFLGFEICNSSVVLESKLSNEESAFYDLAFTLQELDKAAYSLN